MHQWEAIRVRRDDEKAYALAEHLSKVFRSHVASSDDNHIDDTLNSPLDKESAIKFIATFRISHFLGQWKIADIAMILKPGKNTNEVSSYGPISLLPIMSKLFEKILLNRLLPVNDKAIPDQQFGFHQNHSAIQQIHQLVSHFFNIIKHMYVCKQTILLCSFPLHRSNFR